MVKTFLVSEFISFSYLLFELVASHYDFVNRHHIVRVHPSPCCVMNVVLQVKSSLISMQKDSFFSSSKLLMLDIDSFILYLQSNCEKVFDWFFNV